MQGQARLGVLIGCAFRCLGLGGHMLSCPGLGDQGDLPLKEGSAAAPVTVVPSVRKEAIAAPTLGALPVLSHRRLG